MGETGTIDWSRLTASQASAAIARGELTSEALVRACLDRIDSREPVVKAWTYLDADQAIRAARDLDKQPRRGPLHGIPIGIKDMIDTADMPTEHNSPIYAGNRPALDAPCVETLRAAGGLILGKTETLEFAAAGRNAATTNPHDPARTPGGSSSGSAAAVADFQVPLALGTQTGGSTIRPASFCGAYALKPSWGLVNREGAKFYAISFDTIGWYGRSVADLDLLADVYGIADDSEPARGPLAGREIAYCLPFPDATEASSTDAVLAAAELMRSAGARVTELRLPAEFARLNDAHKVILFSEGRASFFNLYQAHRDKLHDHFQHRVENRDGFTKAQLRDAYDIMAQCRVLFEGMAGGFDAVLAPSAPGEAPLAAGPGNPALNQIWTMLHAPVVNIPGWTGPAGMPIGVSLTGPRFTDRKVLAVASAVEMALAADVRAAA